MSFRVLMTTPPLPQSLTNRENTHPSDRQTVSCPTCLGRDVRTVSTEFAPIVPPMLTAWRDRHLRPRRAGEIGDLGASTRTRSQQLPGSGDLATLVIL